MNIAVSSQIQIKATVTPSDAWAASSYSVGPNGEALTIPATADAVQSTDMVLASGTGKVYEPDTHTFDSTAVADPDGGVVNIDTVYAIVMYNTHATVAATYVGANIGTTAPSGEIQAGGYVIHHYPLGITVGATSTITLTGQSGTPTVRIVVIGEAV